MEQTYNDMLRTVTEDYLASVDLDAPLDPTDIENELLLATNNAIEAWNLGPRDESQPVGAKLKDAYPDQKKPGERLRKLRVLENYQIAAIIKELYRAKLICLSGNDEDGDYEIGVYQTEGELAGCHDTRRDDLMTLIRTYNPTIKNRSVDEVIAMLRTMCPRVRRTQSPNLVPVANGIYDYQSKRLLPFDPWHVFTAKSDVRFVAGAPNPIIHNDEDGTDWDVVSWMGDLSDDPDVVSLLWQILGAAIRPNVRWNKSAWLFSTKGNNGKGTLCTLARNLCGKGAWTSIPIKSFGEEFKLEALTHATAIITDENDTGTYLDDAAALKSIVTGEPFLVNRKYREPRSVLFNGFMIQCVNQLPKLRDKTDSMYRRLRVVPMDKSFSGCERKYIKSDYLNRPEVLEYVLFHLLAETDYYELDEPKACRELLGDFKEYNDPVRQFLEDVLPEASWDLLPWRFAFDTYRYWMRRFNPSGKPEAFNAFTRDVKALLPDFPEWTATPNSARSATKMSWPEPLIKEYGVQEWMNFDWTGPNRYLPVLKDRYSGLVRINPRGNPNAGSNAPRVNCPSNGRS